MGLLVVLLGSITIRRLAPAADIPLGAQLDSGFSYLTSDPPRIACNRLEQHQTLQQLARDSTPESVERRYKKWYPACRRFEPGTRARVDERRGLLAGSVCVRPQGRTRCMWTVRDAITRE